MAKLKTSPPAEDAASKDQALGAGIETRVATREFMSFIEAKGYEGEYVDPTSPLGMRLQSEYISTVGEEPLAILKSIAENLFCKPSDRVNAAKIMLEYSRRKIPAQFELSGPEGAAIKLDRSQLSALSPKELAMLEQLLQKAAGDVAR